ncbi:hypothetical protein [Yoonia sp. R2-816]
MIDLAHNPLSIINHAAHLALRLVSEVNAPFGVSDATISTA